MASATVSFMWMTATNEMSGIRKHFNDFYAADTSKKIRAVQRSKGQRGEKVSIRIWQSRIYGCKTP